jgi:hypothetical protein
MVSAAEQDGNGGTCVPGQAAWMSVAARTLLATGCKKLSISAGGDRKKLRRVSRMGYHDITKVAGINSSGFYCVPSLVSNVRTLKPQPGKLG